MKFSAYNLIIQDPSLQKDKQILCNTASGETFLVSNRIKEIFENHSLDQLTDEELSIYLKAGMILENDSIDEALINSYFHEKEKYFNTTLNLTVLLTMACNLRCVYCYEAAGIVSNEYLSDDTRENIFEFIKTQALTRKSEHVALWLFGGEPLLKFEKNKHFLDQTKSFCFENGLGFTTYIVTNGTLITKETLDMLAEYNCQYVQITLDGVKRIHDQRRIDIKGNGSFDDTLKGIKMTASDNRLPQPTIRINIDKTNVNSAYELLEYLKSESLQCCSIDFGIVKGDTPACSSYIGNCFLEEELGEVLEPLWLKATELGFSISYKPEKRSMFCGMYCDSAFTITPNGDVYKCWDFVNDEQHKIGTIGKGGAFLNTTNAYYKWMTRNPYHIEECRSCVYLPTCGGGCAGISYSRFGDYNAPGCYKVKGVYDKQILNKFKEHLKL